MTRKLLLSTALSALMMSAAVAQTPAAPGSAGGSMAPMTTPAKPGAKKATAQKPNASAAANPANAATATGATAQARNATGNDKNKADIVASQKPSQWLASKFKGTAVLGANNKKIGAISDIMFDKSGKIDAYVVSFGGFLGMDAKEVAIAPSSFQVVPGADGKPGKLRVAMNKKELQQAQKFAAYAPPKPPTPTGAGGGGVMSGGGLMTHPSPTSPRMN